MKRERLRERVEAAADGASVDAEKGIVHGVSLLGIESMNGYSYDEDDVKEAVKRGVYTGVHVYANHAEDGDTGVRDVDELIGVITGEPTYDAATKRVKGSIRVFKNSRAGAMLVEAASDPELSRAVGMSHDCDADFDSNEKKVRRIERVHSVDFVTRPATTRGIHESHKEPSMDEKELKALQERVEAAEKRAAELESRAKADAEKAAILETSALVESESKSLPEPVREQLREDFKGRAAKPDEIKAAVTRAAKLVEAAAKAAGVVVGNGFGGGDVTEGDRKSDLAELRETFSGHYMGCKRESYAPSAK